MTNCARRFQASLLTRIFLLLLLLAVPGALFAQGTSATVSGFVTDASGAKVASATVTYTNTATGVSGTATTNGDGLYRITGLLPGNYKSTITNQASRRPCATTSICTWKIRSPSTTRLKLEPSPITSL